MALIESPEILLPKSSIDLHKWSCIACDQFTSEIAYWNHLHQLVDNVPSSYHIILPEAYLELGFETRITQVNDNMHLYLRNHIFETHEGIVLVDRQTPFHPQRSGLVLLIDLDQYEFAEGRKGKIIASEKTVLNRIPPRVKIREKAPIEIPHVIVLFDDAGGIIPDLYRKRHQFPLLYDFDLNMGGGHISGYLINNTQPILDAISLQVEHNPLVVGDGNHSLAAAKVIWETMKETLSPEQLVNHPARYAMVELISIYDPGLAFEPIHRVIFNADHDDFISEFNRASYGSEPLRVITLEKEHFILTPESPFDTIHWVQGFLDQYLESHKDVSIDYVHGSSSLQTIIRHNKSAIGIVMPPLERHSLFPYINDHGALPRKSFSLGEAVEKRYYLESRLIQKGIE